MRTEERTSFYVWTLSVLVGGLVAVFALLLTQCSPAVDGPVPPPKERPTAGTVEDCAAACSNLRAHGCEEGTPTPAGVPCETVCSNVEESGATTLDVGCVVKAESCEVARECGYGAEP